MKPKDDYCVACGQMIDKRVEHYIVWSEKEQGWKRIHLQEYASYYWGGREAG